MIRKQIKHTRSKHSESINRCQSLWGVDSGSICGWIHWT